MKIITNLTATVPDKQPDWMEHRGIVGSVPNCPAKGFYRYAQLQGSGLVLSRGKATVCIPMCELWKLAEQFEPSLIPPAAPAPPIVKPAAKAPSAPK